VGDREHLTFGVDLGGTSTRVGLYDSSMRLLASAAIPTRVAAGPQSCVEEIAGVIRAVGLEGGSRGPENTMGIGIGSPGPINLRTGVLGLLPNLVGWENFPLRDALTAATGQTVVLESDANAAAIAEWKLGAARTTQFDSMAMITLGTGVGSGLILDGKIWQGRFGMGGEVGHATVEPEGLLCGCGSRGCLETYASANGLMRLAQEAVRAGEGSPSLSALVAQPGGFTPLDVATLAENDDSAREVFQRLGSYLGIGIANLINTLDLPLIVVGGGLASSWKLFAPAMFRAVRDYSVVYRLAEPTQFEHCEQDCIFICPAALGPTAGLLGAALLPRLAGLGVPVVAGLLALEMAPGC
jgi:glucokinase